MEKSEAMRKGRRLAYLKKCVIAKELFEQFKSSTDSKKEVFEKNIKSLLGCSYVNFEKMLKVKNPKEEIELLTSKD